MTAVTVRPRFGGLVEGEVVGAAAQVHAVGVRFPHDVHAEALAVKRLCCRHVAYAQRKVAQSARRYWQAAHAFTTLRQVGGDNISSVLWDEAARAAAQFLY